MARKFKCRNGTILEELHNNYGYTILYDPTGYWKKGETIELMTPFNGSKFARGSLHGKGYDIVEELLPKKRRKIPVATNAVLYESSIHDDPPKWFEYAKDKKLELLLDVIKALDLTYEATASRQWGITERTITIHI